MGDIKTRTHLKVGQGINDKNSRKQTHIWLRSPTCGRCFYHMDYTQKRSHKV